MAVDVAVGELVTVAVGGRVGTRVGVNEGWGVRDGGMGEKAAVTTGVCARGLHPASKDSTMKIQEMK